MTGFDLDKYHRQSIRLKGYDYTREGAYFITICTREKESYFELYSELALIVQAQWESIPKRFPDIALDAFVIMPNHIHGIIIVGATLAVAQDRAGASHAPTLGNVVGALKSLCANEWLRYIKRNRMNAVGSIWQRNYYEHTIRNEAELNRVREYIMNNPLKWTFDSENPSRLVDPTYSAEWKWLEGKA